MGCPAGGRPAAFLSRARPAARLCSALAGECLRIMREQSGISALPEINVVVFSFLLNFVWEMWQIPFFAAVPGDPHWVGVAACTRATFGDAGLSLVAFWCVAAVARSRRWIVDASTGQVLGFVALGLVATVILEALATGPAGRWSYGPSMPRLPVLGTGIVPMVQWVLLPPALVWFVRRQLA